MELTTVRTHVTQISLMRIAMDMAMSVMVVPDVVAAEVAVLPSQIARRCASRRIQTAMAHQT